MTNKIKTAYIFKLVRGRGVWKEAKIIRYSPFMFLVDQLDE